MPSSNNFQDSGFVKRMVKPGFIQPLQFMVVANEAIVSTAAAKPPQTMVATPVAHKVETSLVPVFAASAVRKNIMAMPMREEVVFSQLAETKFFNPKLGIDIASIILLSNGLPREQITVPISTSGQITDELLFESPIDASKKFYLPRYRIMQETVSGEVRIRAALEQDGNGGSLTISLQPYAAPNLEEASRTASVLPHGVTILLQYNVNGSLRELEFLEKADTLDPIILRLNELDLYWQVYRALSGGAAFGTKLIIRRLIQVAIPIPLPPRQPKPRPRPHFPPKGIDPDLPPGLKKRLLQKNRFGVPVSMQLAGTLEAIATPQVQLYRATDRALDVPPINADWPELLVGYVYKSPSPPPVANKDNEFIVKSVEFEGRTHHYFQDEARREIFYFLPDSFKLARQPNSPYYPFMSVRFLSTDGLLNTTQAQLAYVAVPFAKPARLKAATAQLAVFVSAENVKDIKVQPLNSTSLTFRLAVPGSVSAAGPFQQREGVNIDLRSALRDQLTLSLNDFQIIYNALATPNSLLFQGEIMVRVHEGTEEAIPFVARLNDLAGDIFDFESVPDAATGTVAVTLRNAIESPVGITHLNASLFYDDVEVPAMLSQFNLPIEVKPEESISFQVTPAPPGAARPGAIPRVAFDMETDVRPNLAAVWASIIDPFAPNEYQKTITIKTFIKLFTDPEKPGIAAILVDVEGSETVELSAEMLVATTVAQLPLSDVILNTPNSGQFRYRISIVQPSGSQIGEWRTAGSTTLFITKDLLP